MPSLARRVCLGLTCAVPLVLTSGVAVAGAAPTSAATGSAAGAATTSAAPSTQPLAAAATAAPAAQIKRPMRWSQYVSQKPAWSAKLCAPDALANAKGGGKGMSIQCARLLTPLDWSDLTKGSIVVNVTRLAQVPAKGSKAKGSTTKARGLFVNPGGPGGPAGALVSGLGALKPALRSTHDIVGVDPRGTGLSTPLPCPVLQDAIPDYRDTSAKARAKVQASYKAWVQTCFKRHGKILPHITTTNTVHDTDLVRRLMGYPTLDWYGVSGGTWMGSWYAQLHPKQAGRIVLDANTQFTTDWRTSFTDFPMGFQRRFDAQALPWIARNNRTYGLGSTTRTVRASYEYIRAEAGKGRVKEVTPNLLDSLTMLLMYDDATLKPFAQSLSGTYKALRTKKGVIEMPMDDRLKKATKDTGVALASAAPKAPAPESPIPVVRTAVLCQDTPYERTPASFERQTLADGKRYPLIGYVFGSIMSPCAYWPTTPKKAPVIDGAGVPRMLMVQNQLDPATPIEGARKAHAANRATRLVVAKGQGGHGAFLSSVTNPCIDKTVITFLQKGSMPDKDLTCAGLPLPGDKKVYDYVTG